MKEHPPVLKSRRLFVFKVLIVLCVIGSIIFAGSHFVGKSHGSKNEKETAKDKYFKVIKGGFNVVLGMDGNLDAIKRHNMRYESRGRWGLEIVEVIEDRTKVKKDEVIVRFSSDKYEKALEEASLKLEDEYKNLALAEEDLEMIKSDNLNNIKFTTDLMRASRDELKKYIEQDAPRKRRELTGAVSTADKKCKSDISKLSEARINLSDGNRQDPKKLQELEKSVTAAEKSVDEAKKQREKALYDLLVQKRYEHPQQMRKLQEAAVKSFMTLQRDVVRAAGEVIKAQRQIKNYESIIEKLQEDIKNIEEDIENLTLRAPVDGIASLGNPMRRPWDREKEIKIGAKISPREIVASIPDLSSFTCHIKIPEEFRSKAKIEMPAVLKSKAIPDLILKGKLEWIAPMAEHVMYWDKSTPKVYSARISTDAQDERLMPGMTMNVEIIVEEVKDVLYVPIEALYNKEGKTYCRVRALGGLREKEVDSGRSSNDYVEIRSGLEEGEEVFLHRQKEAA
ncbi:hypothetical protein ACFLS1_09745 [Verrucomicrobiota bacterium]